KMFLRGKKSIKLVQNARVVTNRAPLVLAAIRCQQTRNITFTKQARFENFSNFKQNTFHRYTQLFTKSIIRSYSTRMYSLEKNKITNTLYSKRNRSWYACTFTNDERGNYCKLGCKGRR